MGDCCLPLCAMHDGRSYNESLSRRLPCLISEAGFPPRCRFMVALLSVVMPDF